VIAQPSWCTQTRDTCLMCVTVYCVQLSMLAQPIFVYTDRRENRFICIILYQWFSTWAMWPPRGHINFCVGHWNFTAWIKYFKFKIESPVSPAAQKAKFISFLFPHLIWLILVSVGLLNFCQKYLTALLLWWKMIFTCHWPQCNWRFKNSKVFIRAREHTEYNSYYWKNICTCIGRPRFTPGIRSWKTWRKSTQNSHLKQCISWGLGDWQPHRIQCMTIH